EHLQTPIEFNQGYTEAFETDVIAKVEQRLESCLADETIRIADCEAASWEDIGWNAMTNMERTWATTPEIELVPVEADAYGDGVDLTEYSGPTGTSSISGVVAHVRSMLVMAF